MKEFKVDISVIIPQRNSLDTLKRLFDSIPSSDRIEILLVDNSNSPITKDLIPVSREYKLLWSAPERYAGGARNVGLENAHGKWIVFADADDFFTPGAFDVFFSHINDNEDLIYFKSESVYDDTLEPSDRHQLFNSYIDNYLSGKSDELGCRLDYLVPWGKMIKADLIKSHNIKFDEVLAANDMYFSTLVGFFCEKFSIDTNAVYVITTRKASLANRRDLPVIKSRYLVSLRRNKFLKENGLSDRQGSVMVYLFQAKAFGLKELWWFVKKAIEYRQNLFLGMKNWAGTYRQLRSNAHKNKEYIKK